MRRLLLILVSLLLVVGCSNQLGYKFADTLIEWQLSDYIELTDEQEPMVAQAIDELHLWHARSELPLYRDLLQNLRDKIATDGLTEAEIAQVFDDATWLWERIRIQIEPYAQVYLAELNPKQRQQLFEKLDENLAERREDLLDEPYDEALKDTRKRLERNVKRWLGSVEPVQRSYLSRWLAQRDDMRADWIAYNERWQSAFKLLWDAPSGEVFSRQLNSLIMQPEALRGDDFQARLESNRLATIVMLYELQNSMTARQKRHLLGEIDDIIADLDDLIAYFAPDDESRDS
ncbi:DUF6279 family lipoprotein [Pseudidiomarina taiwanensis]|uniref:Lipoprotein n=1 Tax=Pseudidiomarina taiwanensis TaxID=337250 RepID=A0A432ZNB1_9GAMM|nr:DUF6279 family lipoprotein [Pseudidiomarina taiwanensis]RUO79342.1 hypothetical protein CWI83_02205 [Pseudidiomarina taiwanensis]